MAPRFVQISTGALICSFVLLPLWAVWRQADGPTSLGPADWSALRFTILQAALSALLSTLSAVPLARALARAQFWGRAALIRLMGAPFILPVIVAILGLIAVFGQNGWLNTGLRSLGFGGFSIYGLQGVLLAHVFFNLPLATRMILLGWATIPQERLRLGQSLDLRGFARFRLIEFPMLMTVLPSAAAVIFVICLSSFTVALALGGGPKSTTLELAIYQAFRFDFDFAKAALLGLVQLGLSASAAVFALGFVWGHQLGIGLDRPIALGRHSTLQKYLDGVVIGVALLFLGLPLLLVLGNGLASVTSLSVAVWMAALRSVLIARPYVNPFEISLWVTLCVNAVMSLPFAVRILRPEMSQVDANFRWLSASLGLSRLGWLRWVVWPRLRRPLGFAAGLTAALSMGDLGVIALFGDAERATLPLKLYQLMGSYRMEQAAGCASLLLILSFGFFWIFDFLGRRNA
jgi:thiamine transport system permease protein